MLVAGPGTRLADHGFVMGSILRTQTARAAAILALGLPLVLTAAIGVAVADDAAGQPALHRMSAIVQSASWLGELLLRRPPTAINLVGGALIALFAVLAVLASRRSDESTRHAAPLLFALTLAVLGQLLLIRGWGILGGGCYLLAVVAAVLSVRRSATGSLALQPRPAPALSLSEGGWLLAIAGVATVFRFFALNRVVDYFEGELSPYMLGATSLRGIVLANSGVHGPWAPLGFLYYLPIFPMVAIAGSTVLAVRLASALIAVITVVVGFLLAREIAGRRAGLAAAAILALDPLQIGWGRSDVHPHGATAWPGLLLAWATLRMIQTRRTGWSIAVALLMGLCWHQYPSGQTAVLVPVLTLAVLLVGDRPALRALGWRLGAVPLGLLLWFSGHTLVSWIGLGRTHGIAHYIASLGTRVAGAEPGASPLPPVDLGHLVGNLGDLVAGIFVEVPHLFHQTFIPEVLGVPARTLPWIVAALAVIGLGVLVARLPSPGSAVILASAACAVAPAVFADVAYVKRAAVLYPVLEIAAAIAAAVVAEAVTARFRRVGRPLVLTLAAVGMLCWVSISAQLWFSQRQYRWGVPPEQGVAEAIADRLEPHSLVIAGFWDSYTEGKLSYLLYDELRRPELAPLVWFVSDPGRQIWRTLVRRPGEIFVALEPGPWYSLWSGQHERLPELAAEAQWRRVLYLLQEDRDADRRVELIRSACPGLRVERVAVGSEERHSLRIAECEEHPGLRRGASLRP
jgi:hypothetical protein